ncbi:MAG: hypothetical protein WDN06_04450 [Asticcacaulis sp.]
MKLRQYIDFNLGRFSELLRIALAAQKAAPEVAYVHGMAAFGYEQCHLLEEAETAARRALDILPEEPWAQHALAHVMLTEGRIDEGVQFLESVSPQWAGLNSFMQTHLWWHLALFRLSQGHVDEVLDLYDRHVWGVDKTYSQDQVGAVSLLARLELASVDVGDRWIELGRLRGGAAAGCRRAFPVAAISLRPAASGTAGSGHLAGGDRKHVAALRKDRRNRHGGIARCPWPGDYGR